jgi:hypothetical protein
VLEGRRRPDDLFQIRFNLFDVSGTRFHRASIEAGYTPYHLPMDTVMATIRVRRTWWKMSHANAPLFRELAQRWRSVDRRDRRMLPFQLALSSNDAPLSRSSFGPQRGAAIAANAKKSSVRVWNPWMMMK